MDSDARLTYKPSKLGHTGLVFGPWSEFVRRSPRAEVYYTISSAGCTNVTQKVK